MRKIGIITIAKVNNYGADLQAFALHHKLKLMGFDNELIDYLYYKNSNYKKELISKPKINHSRINCLKDLVLKYIDVYSQFRYPRVARRREEMFQSFYNEFMEFSPSYPSYSSLYNTKLDYDTVIVGSDQVWNPNNGTNLDPYFLTFAKENVKKVSYASSFGIDRIPKSLYWLYKDWLNNIDFLSTRESSGVDIVKDITGREATHVVDPTLLLTKDEWSDITVSYKTDKPYILLFVFKESNYVKDLAFEIQKKTGYKIIRVCKNEMPVESDDEILNIRDFGPREFLGLYQAASYVITTSFHGTVFSLIFEKPFFVVTPQSKNNNVRQEDLLQAVGLTDRLIKEDTPIAFDQIEDINYVDVKLKLNSRRRESEAYLKTALNIG